METDDGRTRQTRSDGQAGRAAERWRTARGAMRWGRLIQRSGQPSRWLRKHLEVGSRYALRYGEFTCRYLESRIVQPDHASVVVRNLGPVVIVIVGLEVPVDNGMRVVGIRFVDVRGWSNRREHEARHGHESDSRAPRRIHDVSIMGRRTSARQTVASPADSVRRRAAL